MRMIKALFILWMILLAPVAFAATSGSLLMDTNGNYGIGTAVPSGRLDIIGTGTTSAASSLIVRDSVRAVKVMVLNNGNVGIGTAAPEAKLQLDGVFRQKYSTDITENYFIIGSGYELDGTPHASGGSDEFIRWGNSGNGSGGWNLIFGTASAPVLTMSIDGITSGALDAEFQRILSWGTGSAGNDLVDSTTLGGSPHSGAIQFGNGTGWKFYIQRDNANKFMTFQDDGNVGIGTTSARALFEITKDSYLTPFIVTSAGNLGLGTVLPRASLEVGKSASVINGSSPVAIVKGNLLIDGRIYGDGSQLTGLAGSISGLTTNYVTKGTSVTSIGNSQIFDNGTNIGVGTVDPLGKLQVDGIFRQRYVTDTADNYFIIGSGYELDGTPHASGGADEFIRWGNNGNGGGGWDLIFGTAAAPVLTMSIDGITSGALDAAFQQTLTWGSGSAGNDLVDSTTLGGSPHSGAIQFGNGSGWKFYIQRDNANKFMTFQDDGNVGVATTAPVSRLHVGPGTPNAMSITGNDLFVLGNIEFDGRIYGNGSALTNLPSGITGLVDHYVTRANGTTGIENSIIYDTGVRIGIGTASPSETLEVAGSIASIGTGDSYFTSGNVGIGTAAPIKKLDVFGDIRLGLGNTTPSTLFVNNIEGGSPNAAVLLIQPSSGNVSTEITVRPLGTGGVPAIGLNDSPTGAAGSHNFFVGTGNSTVPANAWNFSSTISGSANANSWPIGFNVSNTSAGRFTAMTIINSGNVGIGTNAPLARLHVTSDTTAPNAMSITGSDLYVRGNIEFDGRIYGDGSGLTGLSGAISGLTATRVPVASGSTTIIDSGIYYVGANVGIGSATPGSLLDIYTVDTAGAQAITKIALARDTLASIGDGEYIDWRTATAGAYGRVGVIRTNASQTAMTFSTLNTSLYERMRIAYDGNVGIGTTNPLFPFHIYGGNTSLTLESPLAANNEQVVLFRRSGEAFGKWSIGRSTWGGFDPNTLILAGEDDTYLRMVVRSGGNVGIGTYIPRARLAVGETGAPNAMPITGGDLYVLGNIELDGRIYGDGSGLTGISSGITGLTTNYVTKATSATAIGNSQIFDNATNVGIGTVSPLGKLDIVGIGTTDTTASLVIRNSARQKILEAQDDGGLYLFTEGTERLHLSTWGAGYYSGDDLSEGAAIRPAGNLVISANPDGSPSSVQLTSYVGTDGYGWSSLLHYGNGSRDLLLVKGTPGNVGIGTLTPTTRLHVFGGTGTTGPTFSIETGDSAIVANDAVGTIAFRGRDSGTRAGAYIRAISTGTWGADTDYAPTALQFFTQAASNTTTLTTPRMVINQNGNIGIGGVTAPTWIIHVGGDVDDNFGAFYVNTNSGGNAWANNMFQNDVGAQAWVGIGSDATTAAGASRAYLASAGGGGVSLESTSATGDIRFYTQGSDDVNERLRMTAAGNLGIGTSLPLARLHIAADATAPNAMPITGSDAYIRGNLEVDGRIYGDGSQLTNLPAGISGLTATRVPVASSSTTIVDSVIYSVGSNVGIGTTAPSSLFEVGSKKFNINADGNVGIGSTNPTYTFDIEKTYPPVDWRIGTNINQYVTGSSAVYNGIVGLRIITGDVVTGAGGSEAYGIMSVTELGNDGKAQLAYAVHSTLLTYANDVSYGFYASDDNSSGGGTAYGLYINLDDADVTRYGIYQNSANNNYFAGNVGIGTTTPPALLAIGPGTPNAMPITGRDLYVRGNLEVDGKIYGDGSALTNLSGGISGLTATRVPVASSATTIIDSGIYYVGSNVGVGSTSPRAALDVNGKIMVREVDINDGTLMEFRADSTNMRLVGNTEGRDIAIVGRSGAGIAIDWNNDATTDYFSIWHNSLAHTSANELLRVQENGNVGIGTSAPVARLDLMGSGTTSATSALVIRDSSKTAKVSILDNGNIGMGTTAPDYLLAIRPPGNQRSTLGMISTGGAGSAIFMGASNAYGGSILYNATLSGAMEFQTSSSLLTRMTITEDGNIGIGTTAPATKLRLSGGNIGLDNDGAITFNTWSDYNREALIGGQTGTILRAADNDAVDGVHLQSFDGTTRMFVQQDGNVGIGTTVPQQKLEVKGGSILGTEYAVTAAASMTVNWINGNQQYVTLNQAGHTINFSNYKVGQVLRLIVCQDGTGGRTVTTWDTNITWASGTAPTLTSTASRCDIISFVCTNAKGSVRAFGAMTANF